MISFIIFLIAFFGILALLGLHSYELERGRATFLTSLSGTFDEPLIALGLRIKYWLSRVDFKKALVFASLLLAHAAHDVFHLIKLGAEKVQGQFSSLINLIKGRHDLGKRGASSVYLKSIGEYKKEINGVKK
ncbi:MAG: hypothetical protein WC250_00890 [Candidatus Paceibacterota bacterium]|jgi:hypothetical protein